MKKVLSIFTIIAFFGVIRYFYLNNPSKNETPFAICMTKRIANIDCPGCGGQRAFHQLLNGNLLEAGKLNIFIYFFAPLLAYIFFSFALKPFNINFPDIDISTRNLGLILLFFVAFTVVRNFPF
ncbi:MAG: DUF2752 domain-containing protein [Flavobacteriaceae bacterium]|nr:DUF2752 domain-containing protein [Flavobacteriaceae bacterium]